MSRKAYSRTYNDSLYYTLEQEEKEDETHPHHQYFKLYEKYTSEASDTYTFHQQHQQKESLPQIYPAVAEGELEKIKGRVLELQAENQGLRKEIVEQGQLIGKLQYELYYCNTQLEQITKVESYQYQQAVDDLRQEIERMLQKTKATEHQLTALQYQSTPTHNYYQQLTRILPIKPKYACPPNGAKENQQMAANQPFPQYLQKELESSRQFIRGVKDMYGKVMGGDAGSLKEVWKWLKDLAQMNNRLKKWSRKYRQFIKIAVQVSTNNLIQLLDQAMIIIN